MLIRAATAAKSSRLSTRYCLPPVSFASSSRRSGPFNSSDGRFLPAPPPKMPIAYNCMSDSSTSTRTCARDRRLWLSPPSEMTSTALRVLRALFIWTDARWTASSREVRPNGPARSKRR